MAAVSAPKPLTSLSSYRRTLSKTAASAQRRDPPQDNEPKLTNSKQSHQQRSYPNNGYLPNGVPESNLNEKQPGTFMNNQARVLQSGASRILCVADVRGMTG